MKLKLASALLVTAALLATGAMAQDKKQLAFVVNGASDFWKLAEAGVKIRPAPGDAARLGVAPSGVVVQ